MTWPQPWESEQLAGGGGGWELKSGVGQTTALLVTLQTMFPVGDRKATGDDDGVVDVVDPVDVVVVGVVVEAVAPVDVVTVVVDESSLVTTSATTKPATAAARTPIRRPVRNGVI